MGLSGGISTFGYAGMTPMNAIDRNGLAWGSALQLATRALARNAGRAAAVARRNPQALALTGGTGAGVAYYGNRLANDLSLLASSTHLSETASEDTECPEITSDDLEGKTQEEIEDIAKQKGLIQDPKKPNKWRDPITGKERLRIDSGHIDPTTGKPYDNPCAAVPHVHGYNRKGKKIGDPNATDDPHFPLLQ